MNSVTFIIPTMGRSSLAKAVNSLEKQVLNNWKAIVVFDNRYEVNFTPTSDKVMVMQADKGGHAGTIRNYAMDYVATDWMAFLDDDDWVAPSYTQKLRGYLIARPELDLVIFTYKDVTNGNTIPHKNQKKIESCKVGISFAVKTEFVRLNKIKFTEFAVEDFRFLDECSRFGAKYFIPHDLQYYVGGRGKWLREE